ncbi:MAG: GAF domain-containing sensor histidine kinase [Gemmatimonadetes bacterium]|nr:GAF domain-containing sensor histidine kinase [Gemmatimonadota bacterium]
MRNETLADAERSHEHEVLSNADRLERLRATSLLDAPREEGFDRLTRLATKLLEAPLSTVTLVDDERQFYMSCTGLPEPLATTRQTPLEYSFCKHTVVLGKPLIVPDVRGHPIVGDNPAITAFGVTAYAGIPLLTSDGHALGTLCVMDFKVRHWTDDQVSNLKDLAAAVSTEIELRMDIAERMRVEKALHRAVRMRDEMLGIVSHDLRNPVHTVSLASGMLLETLSDGPGGEPIRKSAEIIRRAAQQMDHLLGDLLDVATIGSGRLSVELIHHDSGLLLQSACEGLRPLAEAAGLEFHCRAAPGSPTVRADYDRIVQLLSNLVGNAAKFTPSGGRIEVGFDVAEGEACFRVADTGAGIAAEDLPHIFEQFWQASPAGRHGAGLGLTICQGIVEAHGGRIWAESQVGEGTTFYFTLPLAS